MTPTGNTNVTIGLQMAWQTLSPAAPFNAPAAAPDLDKVIILLTDGENTQNRWTSSTSSIDARTQKACDNVKAANIKIYTVRVIDGNATLLKNCATKPDMYLRRPAGGPAQQRVHARSRRTSPICASRNKRRSTASARGAERVCRDACRFRDVHSSIVNVLFKSDRRLTDRLTAF